MSDKFDEFEKERQEQENVIEELRGEVSSLNEKLNYITEQVDRQEQYFRQNCLPINGITKKIRKTDAQALEVFKDIELTHRNLDRTHQIGKNNKSN